LPLNDENYIFPLLIVEIWHRNMVVSSKRIIIKNKSDLGPSEFFDFFFPEPVYSTMMMRSEFVVKT